MVNDDGHRTSVSDTPGGICRGEAAAIELPMDLTFPPTGLSENLGAMERGRGGKGKGGGDNLPYWLLPEIPPW